MAEHCRKCNGEKEDIFAKFLIISCHTGRMVVFKWIFGDWIQNNLVTLTESALTGFWNSSTGERENSSRLLHSF